MERSRDGYRGRYRDRHTNGSINRNNHEDRSTRGNYRYDNFDLSLNK
jgi:hypothetical protein